MSLRTASLSLAGILTFLFFTNVCAEDLSITANDENNKVNLTVGKNSETDVNPVTSEPESEQEQEEEPVKAIKKKRPTNAKILRPDVTNDVHISITEINRISSDEEITSIKYDKKVENLIINYKGKNAYILYTDQIEVLAYIETENNVYPVRFIPAEVKAAHYVLSDDTQLGKSSEYSTSSVNLSNKIHSTNKEKRFIEMLQYAYGNPQTEEGSVEISRLKNVHLISDIEIYKYKTYTFLDDGLYINVYLTRLHSSCREEKVEVSEKDFLIPEIANYPIGISLEHNLIDKERYTRIFVLGASSPGGANEI
ncbi:MAG: hypothetical protein VR65_04620 [Desulfobulbaceae bacterium BRH_c16a]|nr:MAG: hypothetical protein VR65_04620 [Desulfobulbaceae bacterium BRH_c16a]